MSSFLRPECESQVKGFCKPTYKKFASLQEAQQFVGEEGIVQRLEEFSSNIKRADKYPNVNQNLSPFVRRAKMLQSMVTADKAFYIITA